MINQIVTLGDKIDLYKVSNGRKENQQLKVYKSQIIDFIDEDNAKISMPFDGAKMVPLDIGDKYNLCFYTNKGLFNCIAVIKERYRHENLFILEVQFLSELEKYQRREFFRLSCLIEIQYRIIDKKEKITIEKLESNNFKSVEEKEQCEKDLQEIKEIWVDGTITDLSGGGARLSSAIQHEKDEQILIKMSIVSESGEKTYHLNANVISSIKFMNRIGVYENRVMFYRLKNEDREAIIKFVFDEERRIRRKEKGLD